MLMADLPAGVPGAKMVGTVEVSLGLVVVVPLEETLTSSSRSTLTENNRGAEEVRPRHESELHACRPGDTREIACQYGDHDFLLQAGE